MARSQFSALTTSVNCGICASFPSCRRDFKPISKDHFGSGMNRHSPWHQCVQNINLRGSPRILTQRNVKVKAGSLFNKEGGKEVNEISESSESANEDIMIFLFQLELASRFQYALNTEQYDIVQQLSNKLTELEEGYIKQQEGKRGLYLKSEAQDNDLRLIRLRSKLQKAIKNENYTIAAEIRDQISRVEAESLVASAKALTYENAQYAFRLGQKVKHKIYGYRAVICGMDPVCCESSSWMEVAQVKKLARGSDQPFYQVLVDVNDVSNLPVAYVAEENLVSPEKPDLGRFDHPYISFLFYGMDTAGDFIPIQQLREKYIKPRHEVPYPPEDSGAAA